MGLWYLHTSKESALNEKNKELLDAIKAKDDKILEVIKTIRMTLKVIMI
jgi:hypothetical protein